MPIIRRGTDQTCSRCNAEIPAGEMHDGPTKLDPTAPTLCWRCAGKGT